MSKLNYTRSCHSMHPIMIMKMCSRQVKCQVIRMYIEGILHTRSSSAYTRMVEITMHILVECPTARNISI